VAPFTGAAGPFSGNTAADIVAPMAVSVPTTTELDPEVDTLLEPRLDLRDLTESSTSFGSYGLRWQLVESAKLRYTS